MRDRLQYLPGRRSRGLRQSYFHKQSVVFNLPTSAPEIARETVLSHPVWPTTRTISQFSIPPPGPFPSSPTADQPPGAQSLETRSPCLRARPRCMLRCLPPKVRFTSKGC